MFIVAVTDGAFAVSLAGFLVMHLQVRHTAALTLCYSLRVLFAMCAWLRLSACTECVNWLWATDVFFLCAHALRSIQAS